MIKETDEEWLERLQKEIADLQERIAKTDREWQKYLDSPQHQEYLESKKKLEELIQSLESTARNE